MRRVDEHRGDWKEWRWLRAWELRSRDGAGIKKQFGVRYHPAHMSRLLKQISYSVHWDGSPIYRAKAIKEFLAAGAAKRLHLERLPSYAPELPPQEGIWNLLKRRELKNRCCQNLSFLRDELVQAKERLRHRKKILQSYFLHALGTV